MPDFGYSTAELAVITACLFAAGFVKGVIAFAFPIVVVGVLANFIDPAKAVALGLIPGMMTSMVQVKPWAMPGVLRRYWLLQAAIICGLVVGAAVAAQLSRPAMLVTLGTMILGLTTLFAVNPRFEIAPAWRRAASVPFGLTSGFFAGLSSVYGPPVAMYFVAIKLTPDEFVVAISTIFTITWGILILAYGAFGLASSGDLILSVIMLVPALTGLWLGDMLRRRINGDLFRRVVLIALAISGARLIAANVQALF